MQTVEEDVGAGGYLHGLREVLKSAGEYRRIQKGARV